MASKRPSNFIRVDENGQSISAKRRAAVVINPSYKKDGMNAVLRSYLITCMLFKTTYAPMDIMLSCYLFNVTFNVWNGIRQTWNANGGGRKKEKAVEAKTMTINYHGMNLTCNAEELHNAVEAQILKIFPDAKTSREIVGTLVTQFCLCNLYYIRFKGLKYSDTLIKVGTKMEDNELKMANMACSDAGVPIDCVGMINGINWPPSVRSSLGTSTGAMTPAVLLAREMNPMYQNKLKNLVKRNTSHLGGSGSTAIAEFLSRSTATESKSVISTLSRILAFVGGRTQERIAFPPTVWALAMIEYEDMQSIGKGVLSTEGENEDVNMEENKEGEKKEEVKKAKKEKKKHSEIEIEKFGIQELIKKNTKKDVTFDFSGDGGLILYQKTCAYTWTMHCTTAERAKQLHMHATFNYDFEDFAVLAKVTEHKNWEYRHSFSEDFKLLNITAPSPVVSFNPIKMVYCSKMASASSTALLGGERLKVNTVHVQSGYMIKNISDEQIAQLTEGTSVSSIGHSREDVMSFLLQIQEKLRKRFETQKSYIQGTTDWFHVGELLKPKEERLAARIDIVGNGECYWGLGRD